MIEKRNPCIVVGIGDPLLKDGRVGIEVVQKLKTRCAPVDTVVLNSVGFDVLDVIMGYQQAVVVDVCQMGLPPGTILELTPDELFRDHEEVSSDALALASTLRTGQMVYAAKMPPKLNLILVEPEDITSFSKRCSPVVSHAIMDVVARIHPPELAYGQSI